MAISPEEVSEFEVLADRLVNANDNAEGVELSAEEVKVLNAALDRLSEAVLLNAMQKMMGNYLP